MGAIPLRLIDKYGATLLDYSDASQAPPEIFNRLQTAGISHSLPRIASGGGGHSGIAGKVTVQWRPKEEIDGLRQRFKEGRAFNPPTPEIDGREE